MATDAPLVVPLANLADGEVAYASAASSARVLAAGARAAGREDAWVALDGPDAFDVRAPPAAGVIATGRVLAYETRAAAPLPPPARHRADPARVAGNAFLPLFETARAAGALLGVAAGRRVDTGPESERAFLCLAGTGLVFLQDETTLPILPGDLAVVPAGEPARVWSRGPRDLVALALQPQTPPAERRTLAGELKKLREARAGDAAP